MKVTTKGQVTIPARVRGYLGIQPHSEVAFEIRGTQVVLVTVDPAMATRRGKFARVRGILGGRLTTDQWMKATRRH